MQSKQNAILARQTTFRIPSTCPNVSSSSHVPPPKVVIAGIGDSGTRGVRNLLYKLGVQMCSIVNPASDNECSMLPHNNIYSLLACTRGHVSASGYATCGKAFTAAVDAEADGVARSWHCLGDRSERLWGFKNPRHVYLLPVIEHLYAAATMPILVARDPRDVCTGSNTGQFNELRRYGRYNDCFAWWASTWSDILEGDGAKRFVIVRIEDLVLPEPRADGASMAVVHCLAKHAKLGDINTTTALSELQVMHGFAGSYGGSRHSSSTRQALITRTAPYVPGSQPSKPAWHSWFWRSSSSNGGGGGGNTTTSSDTVQRVMRLLGYSLSAYSTQAPAFTPSAHKRVCAAPHHEQPRQRRLAPTTASPRCPSLPAATAARDERASRFLRASTIAKSAKRQPAAAPRLADCSNLAVAGTGSRSLTEAMKAIGLSQAQHKHGARIASSARRKCYLLTLRDPAKRLESGFRYDLTHPETPRSNSLVQPSIKSLTDFVAALRNSSYPGHHLAKAMYEQSVIDPSKGFQRMATLPLSPFGGCPTDNRLHKKCIGSHFLVPQLDYLLDADAENMEVHFLCAERLGDDWRSVRRSFGQQAEDASMPLYNRREEMGQLYINAPSIIVPNNSAAYASLVKRRSTLSESDRAFVRECLFPFDTQLHQLACGGGTSAPVPISSKVKARRLAAVGSGGKDGSESSGSARAAGRSVEKKLLERAALRTNSSGLLLIAVGANAAAECSLAAATARAHGSKGPDGERLRVVLMADDVAAARVREHGTVADLFDEVRGLPEEAAAAVKAHGAWAAKVSSFAHTPFDFTLFIDCDVSVAMHDAPRDLLALTQQPDTDIALSETAFQSGGAPGAAASAPFAHGRAGVCTCVLAWASLSVTRQLWRDARRRFDTPGDFHPGISRRGDQEALWAELERRSRTGAAATLAVRVLPLEWQCPAMLPVAGRGRPRIEFGGGSRIPSRACRFTHSAGGAAEHQLSAVLPAYETALRRMPHVKEVINGVARIAGVAPRQSTAARSTTSSSSSCPLIVIGLPKTGTSSIAEAIERLGFNMMHNAPSADALSWPGCDGLANAAEHEYEEMHRRYPCATWIVAYSSNRSQWLGSLNHQLAKNSRRRGWTCPAAQRIFGDGNPIAAEVKATTGITPPSGCAFDAAYHGAFHKAYYRRLFGFFSSVSLPHRLLDVRKGHGWRELGPIRGRCPAPATRFPSANSRSAQTADYVGRCEVLNPSFGPLSRWFGAAGKPSRPVADREAWVKCA